MSEYENTVERDAQFLLIRIPALVGVTHARFPDEVERNASDYVAVWTETPIEDVTIRVHGTVPTFSTSDYEVACADPLTHRAPSGSGGIGALIARRASLGPSTATVRTT